MTIPKKIKESPLLIPALALLAVFVCLCLLSSVWILEEYTIGGITILLLLDYLILIACFAVILKKSHKRFGRIGSLTGFFLSPLLCFFIVESLNTVSVFSYDLWTGLFNYLTYLMLHLLLYAMTSRLRVAVIAASAISLLFGMINHFAMQFRGNPFLPWDVSSVKTALSVAGNFKVDFTLDLFLSVILWVLLLWTTKRMTYVDPRFNKNALHIVRSRAILAVVIAGYSFVLLGTSVPKSFGIEEWAWRQNVAYQQNGSLTNFILNLKYLIVPQPAGYSTKKVEQLAEEANSKPTPSTATAQPDNIVVIMSESFSDLSIVGDFQTNEDYMPFFRSLARQENTITGNNYVSVIGGNTCNTEFEMLTGNTTAFLPSGSIAYQQYVKKPLPSTASLLSGQGFSATALHPYFDTGWNRDVVYPLLGFERFLSLYDWLYASYERGYISDQSNYDKIISEYEAKPAGEKSFFFNISMQNHGGYSEEDYKSTIRLTDMEGDYPETEQYLSLIKQSDDALKKLLDYFRVQEEKTLLLFFGDHQPSIEDEFYEELYGKKLDDLSLTELQKRYVTPYVLWANYDIPETEYGDVSANYLSPILLETAGLALTDYQQFLLQLHETLPAITANGYRDVDGHWYAYEQSGPHQTLLNDYRILAYNNLFGNKDRIATIFE